MGRECTVFELAKPTYENIRKAIIRKADNRVIYTIEFYPEEGKYHFSGHRNCKVVFGPDDIKTKGNICPVCNRRLTEGVLYRLNQLSKDELLGRVEQKYNNSGLLWYTDNLKIHPPFVKLVPLNEIIAESIGSPVMSEKVKIKFDELCSEFGSEINILLKTPILEIEKKFGEKIAEAVMKVRHGDIFIDPGYDGEYGKVKIWSFDSAQDKSAENKTEPEKTQLGLEF
jgi:PHP family Zn ribbon phosphoesterase